MTTVSKPQRFALEAETIDGWTVKRIKGENGLRTVVVRRADEAFRFEWVPNPDGRGSHKFSRGRHLVGDKAEDYANVKGALREMRKPVGQAKIKDGTRTPRVAKVAAPKLRKPRADAQLNVLPFDPDSSADHEILAACAGLGVTWRNSISGEEEYGVAPRGGLHYRIDHPSNGKRVLTFVDQRYTMKIDAESGGWRSVDVSQITRVG